jgi:predicted dehydrogenase/threonine dehydrogenase-like Zn-dependent dehydrogenase
MRADVSREGQDLRSEKELVAVQQVVQDIRRGALGVHEVPAPMVRSGEVLIANACSLVSAGTEKMVLDLARKSLLGKARERPDHVRRVIEKIRSEGFFNTLRQVREKFDAPMAMGYSSAGIVLATGAGVQEYKPGDRVASNGPHAEIVSVPRHLCARIPDNVPFDQAAFGVLGAIALQGVRLSHAALGETVLVIGLGLVGQITVALLKAAGCRVLGTDPDPSRCELALTLGAQAARPALAAGDVEALSQGRGADAVIITASTRSNEPIETAAAAVRKKGRVVLVGVVGLTLDRRPFYFKEAEFVVSCSYGPGRYDPEYEERGHDYPTAHVRWTEQRNIQAVLDLLGAGSIDFAPLISHRFPIAAAQNAYALVDQQTEPFLGIVLTYPACETRSPARRIELSRPARAPQQEKIGAGVLGCGNFARMVLLPAICACEQLRPALLCSAGGLSAAHSARKLGFDAVTTDEAEIFSDPKIGAIFSAVRHDQHARHVLAAIVAGKPIFVEKPLCLDEYELAAIEKALDEAGPAAPPVMVGFNRRFSPAARQVRRFFEDVRAPITVSIRFNAGALGATDWTQNDETGGGRIVGEACHAIDLATYITGSLPVRVFAESIGGANAPAICDDQCFITLRHANGSITSVGYLAGGDKAFGKERVEVIGGGRVATIDDFRTVTTCAGGKTKRYKLGGQDKGHIAEIRAFAETVSTGGAAPISFAELKAVSLAAILAVRSLREGMPLELIS